MKKSAILFVVPLLLVGSVTACKSKNKNSYDTNTNTGTGSQNTPGSKIDENKYVEAFDNFLKAENMTVKVTMSMTGETNEGMKQELNQNATQKIDGLKLSYQQVAALKQIVTEEYLENYYTKMGLTTDEQKREVFNMLVNSMASSGFSIENNTGTSFAAVMGMTDSINYGEKDKDNELFVYEYVDTELKKDQYYKSRTFMEESDSFGIAETFEDFLPLFGSKETYQNLTYDETNGVYQLSDVSRIATLFGGSDVEIESAVISVKFNNNELVSFGIQVDAEGEKVEEMFEVEAKGTTRVTLPTSTITCEHERTSTIFNDYVSGYHYSECYDCGAVLDYEEHTFEHNACTKCNAHKRQAEIYKTIGLPNEHMNSHFSYDETVDGTITNAYVHNMDYEYDSVTGSYVYTCADEECNLKIVSNYTYAVDSNNSCMRVQTENYSFFIGESETPVKTLAYSEYHSNHDFEYTYEDDPNHPCYKTSTATCERCGLVGTSKDANHMYEDTYSADGCLIKETHTCEKCNKVVEEEKEVHKLLNIQEKEGSNYKCHCDECNEDVNYRINFYDNNNYGHYASNHTTGSYYLMPHTYDTNGVCVLCGYDKDRSSDEVEWLYCYYEGKEYLFFTKNSLGQYTGYYYDGYDYEYDFETSTTYYVSRYSDYNFVARSYYEDESGWRQEVIVKKGTEVVFQYVS